MNALVHQQVFRTIGTKVEIPRGHAEINSYSSRLQSEAHSDLHSVGLGYLPAGQEGDCASILEVRSRTSW